MPTFERLRKERLGMWSGSVTAPGQAPVPSQGPSPVPAAVPPVQQLGGSDAGYPALDPNHSQLSPLDHNWITGETTAMETSQAENADGQD